MSIDLEDIFPVLCNKNNILMQFQSKRIIAAAWIYLLAAAISYISCISAAVRSFSRLSRARSLSISLYAFEIGFSSSKGTV